MITSRTVHDVDATPHFNFLYGSYRLSNWTIPYFSTTMSIDDAAQSLHLTSEIPGAEEINWKVDELYQRDIDWPRVEGQIAPYLRDPDVPQFFNAITIALLPYDDGSGELLSSFSDGNVFDPPPLSEPQRFRQHMSVGPISFGFWDEWSAPTDLEFQSGQLRWNKKQIFGVAIDGQHRLAALKVVREGGGGRADLSETHVPVILLLFDTRVGFERPSETRGSVQVELLRKLFIDLNKHARTVSRARQILLDDRDPHAVCVRRLVGNELTSSLEDLQVSEPRLPLSLVDWHSEQAKFDQGPYLTTILGVDWIVSQVLETRPIKDYTDYRSIRSQISRLQKRLRIDLSEASKRLDDRETSKLSPFSYTDDELESVSSRFGEVWSRPICNAFARFRPYADLVEHRAIHTTLSLDFQHWYELRQRQKDDPFEGRATQDYRKFLGRLLNRKYRPMSKTELEDKLAEIENLKSGNLAFNVAFQRAYISAFLEYQRIGPRDVEELGELTDSDDEVDFDDEFIEIDDAAQLQEDVPSDELSLDDRFRNKILDRTTEYVDALNRAVDSWPDVLNVYVSVPEGGGVTDQFWSGTLLKPEGGIDFTQGASSRAQDLLFAAAAMCLYDDNISPGPGSDFDEFWIMCTEGEDAPSVCRRVGRAVRRFCDKERSAAGRILKARGVDFNIDTARDEAYWRLRQLWIRMGL